jgi:hypothetical protein
MAEKWLIACEGDLTQGVWVLARKNAGSGEVAMFDSKEEAQERVESSGKIDAGLFEITNRILL